MRTAGVFELFTRRTICFFCPRRVAVNEHAAANADKASNLRPGAFVPEGCAIARAPRPSMFNAYRLMAGSAHMVIIRRSRRSRWVGLPEKCPALMGSVRITAVKPGFDHRSFECRKCRNCEHSPGSLNSCRPSGRSPDHANRRNRAIALGRFGGTILKGYEPTIRP